MSSVRQYQIGPEIGEGTFATVILAHDSKANRQVALKVMPLNKQDRIKQEVTIHQMAKHVNIIRLYECFQEGSHIFMALEWAAGGELFDKIQPDVGLTEDLSHFYFHQLINGVSYLHANGISHRDLKPENLLLDKDGNLRIADFGLATMFCNKGKIRRLHTVCGTKPYVAPEVLLGDYDGRSCDIWSCGVILYVLMTGQTPWHSANEESIEFCRYATTKESFLKTEMPWKTFNTDFMRLLCGLLEVYEQKRYNVDQIKQDGWFCKRNSLLVSGRCADPEVLASRLMSSLNIEDQQMFSQMSMAATQQQQIKQLNSSDSVKENYAFSQPINIAGVGFYTQAVHMDLSQQVMGTSSQKLQLFHDRLTRFFLPMKAAGIHKKIKLIFEDFIVQFKEVSSLSLAFYTVDDKKCPLNGVVQLMEVPGQDTTFINFKKTKGDPLEFKRFFQAVKSSLCEDG